MTFRKILIAVDDTPCAAHAADMGIDLARQLGAEVAFITIVDTGTITYDPNSDLSADEWLATLKGEARRLLKAFAARRAVAPPALEFLEEGRPAAKIVEAARSWHADVVVMGTHGRNALATVFVGSVAQGVLHNAPCPVMVLTAASA